MKTTSIINILIFMIVSFEVFSATSRDTLRIPIRNSIKDLNPHQSVRADVNRINYQIFEPLVNVNSSGHVRPGLASSWKMDMEKKELTFKLRPNVQFSDGSSMNAQDVEKSLNHSLKQGNKIEKQIQSVSAVNLNTIKIKMKNRNTSLLLRKLASQEGLIFKRVNGKYLGTGPFKLILNSENLIRLQRIRPTAKNGFNTIEFYKFSRDKQVSAFLENKVDELYFSNQKGNFTAFMNNIVNYSFTGTMIAVLNTKTTLFKDIKEREHFSKQVDKEFWFSLYNMEGDVASSLIPEGMIGHIPEKYKTPKKSNRKKLKQLRIGMVKGVFKKEKEDLIKKELNSMGYKPVFVYDGFIKLLKKFRRGEIDLAFKMDSAQFFEPAALFNPYTKGSNSNVHEYVDKELNDLYLQAEASVNTNEKAKILKNMQKRLSELKLIVPIAYPKLSLMYSNKINAKKLRSQNFSFWSFNYRNFEMSLDP